jgi:catechol 2,3-dioxygenase-like lactoylglutathione lyase family enzyme
MRKGQTVAAVTAQTAEANIAAPPAIGLLEFTLEVADLTASERFYADHLGLRVVERWGADRPAIWLAIGREGFVGLWTREAGGPKALFNGRGGAHVHFAIRVPYGTLDTMKARLEALGYAVGAIDFGKGDRAIYVDDPDGNLVELTERKTLWDGSPATE